MANRCETTVRLYGDNSKIAEVISYLKNSKQEENEETQGYFASSAFSLTHSWCAIIEPNILVLQTLWASPSKEISELSKKFPEAGLHSSALTDGEGQLEEEFMIGGRVVYYQYLDVQSPEYWKNVTGSAMCNTFWDLAEEKDWYKLVDQSLSDVIRDDYYR
jgi:hypothetical protein